MFLVFVLLFCGITGAVKLIKDYSTERKRRHTAISRGYDTYYDRYGRSVEVDTDIPYSVGVEKRVVKPNGYVIYGDSVRLNEKGDRVIRNLTDEWRNKRIRDRSEWKRLALDNGDEYYKYDLIKSRTNGGYRSCDRRPCFDGYAYEELPKTNVMWANVKTDKKYFALCCTVWNIHIGIILWDLETRNLEIILDRDRIPIEYVKLLEHVKNKSRGLFTKSFFAYHDNGDMMLDVPYNEILKKRIDIGINDINGFRCYWTDSLNNKAINATQDEINNVRRMNKEFFSGVL